MAYEGTRIVVELGAACHAQFGNPEVAIAFLKTMLGQLRPEAWLALVRKVEPGSWDVAMQILARCGGWGS